VAQRRGRPRKKSGVSPVASMLFGLAVGLSVAAAVYMKDRRGDVVAPARPEPASLQSALDENGEAPPADEPAGKDEEPAESAKAPQAVVEPGVYILQAGSFSTHEDADRRRAELGLQGITSHIQRVKINERNYHRVLIGPIDDLDELNVVRSRLRAAQIDVLRIRVSD